MTRSRSRSRSNRLKRNKTKRYRQTKNKRHRQHGGEHKYSYTTDSQTILKQEAVSQPVLIPGYSEIMDMMQEYEDPHGSNPSENLKEGIKLRDVQQLSGCSLLPNQIHEDKIIVVRKEDKRFFLGLTKGNNSIECTHEQYYALASHNFRIFIQDILKWNPFLNLPHHKKKEEQPGSQGYQPHVYKSDKNFTDNEWWSQQSWWNDIKKNFTTEAQASAAQEPLSLSPQSSVDLSSPPQPRQQPNLELEQQNAKLRTGLHTMKTTLNYLHTQERITEEVKNTLTTQIDSLLQPTYSLPSS